MPTEIQQRIERIATNGIMYCDNNKYRRTREALKLAEDARKIPGFGLLLVRLDLSRLEAIQTLQNKDYQRETEIRKYIAGLRKQMRTALIFNFMLRG